MTTIALTSADPAAQAADVLVVAIAPAGGRKKAAVVVAPTLKAAASRRLAESLAALGATGKTDEIVKLPGAGISSAPVVIAVGLGAGPYTEERLRRAAGEAARALNGTRRAVVALPHEDPASLDAVVQGLLLGAYDFTTYRVDSLAAHSPVGRITLHVGDVKDPETLAAVARGRTIAGAVNLARDLVNTPADDLVPDDFAAVALAQADALGLGIEVLDENALEENGYGGILAVGKGSAHPPRLVRLAYRPEGATAHLALVGKGITFDTGGISIKPSLLMHEMKGDMGGAAAALGATVAAATLGLPVAITTYLCLAENMPSGRAQKPGDVYRAYGGRTVEVLDTDAEGRLVMADALVRAQEDKPDVLIDLATLTGAAVIALGARTAGIMANDDDLRDAVHDAAVRAGETTWPMPQPEELRAHLDSHVADIANIPLVGRREGGMLSASIFLREFVKDSQRWAHIDIAGPAYNSHRAWGYTPRGGTGFAVRTLTQLAEDLADGEV
ncbi:MAG TPA: leucyl aminopeptidase [Candidatus Nanopelagicales bacterium]|nr:leucyl aminopeptidase [Candidatus Nanopelagicales bacterium]